MPRTVRSDHNLKPGKPVKPENLSERAAQEWDRLTTELESSQIQVSTAHRTLLVLAATIAADIAKAWDTVKHEGEYVTNPKTGVLQSHPASKRLDALRRDYLKVLTQLGLRALPASDTKPGPTLQDLLNGEE
jgi:phage terminase small subunit